MTLPLRNSILVSGWEATHWKKIKMRKPNIAVSFFVFFMTCLRRRKRNKKDDQKLYYFLAGTFLTNWLSELRKMKKHYISVYILLSYLKKQASGMLRNKDLYSSVTVHISTKWWKHRHMESTRICSTIHKLDLGFSTTWF